MTSTRLLGWDEPALNNVQKTRGWTQAALLRLEVGWDGARALIPVHEQSGDLLGHLHYDPTGQHRPKMRAEPGTPRELFPPPEMIAEDEPRENTLLLVEGEPDCILMWSRGWPAVAVPGAQNWRPEWAWRFRSRGKPHWTVAVWFDCDEAGRAGARRAADDLTHAGVNVKLMDDTSRDDGYDLTDLWRSSHG